MQNFTQLEDDDVVLPVEDVKPAKEDTPYQKTILAALNRTGRHVYAGTVTDSTRARRRKANRQARVQRKSNRHTSKGMHDSKTWSHR